MNIQALADRTPLTKCNQTHIQNDLLEALLVNKRRVEKYQHINPIISGGHGRHHAARQILSYLMRQALSIVRRPGTYDIELDSENFSWLSNRELEDATSDVTRIYQHSQNQLMQYADSVKLVRGISGIEAAVCAKLLKEIDSPEIPYYFQTITFFNHVCGAFSREIKVFIDCPVNWIWASAYTLEELVLPASDEEFIVVCQSKDGIMKVPKNNFEITPSIHQIEKVIPSYFNNMHEDLSVALSALMLEGFEPDNYKRTIAQYRPGKWEEIFMKFGRWLDLRSNSYSNGVLLNSRRSH